MLTLDKTISKSESHWCFLRLGMRCGLYVDNCLLSHPPCSSAASVVQKSVESVDPFVSLCRGGEKTRCLLWLRCPAPTSNIATSTSAFGGSGGYSIGSNAIAFNLGNGLSDQSLASPEPSVYSPMGGGGAYTQNFSAVTQGESQSQFTAQLQQGSQEYTQNYYNGTATGFLYNTLTALPRSWQQYTPFGWAGSGLAATGNTISGWGNAAARQGDSNAGTAAMFTGGLFNAASSILNPIGSAENLGAASVDVGTMYGNAAGIGYGIGSLIGATQITQAITGENFATGQSLVGLNRWGMAFQGISAASGTAALGAGTWNATMAAENATGPLLQRYLTESGGRWGSSATRALNDQLARDLIDQGYTITGGAGRASEEYIAGAGPGTTGGTFVDITGTNGTSTIRIQTINTLANGAPTSAEAAAAARIRAAFPNDQLILIPK